jgi:hypothetical protein
MPDWLITFNFYIDERKRPENFPRVLHDLVFVKADSKEAVVEAVNTESFKYIRLQGVSVRKDPYAVEQPDVLDTARMFVPMHMWTHFDADVKPVTGEMPVLDKTGLASFISGKEVVKN